VNRTQGRSTTARLETASEHFLSLGKKKREDAYVAMLHLAACELFGVGVTQPTEIG